MRALLNHEWKRIMLFEIGFFFLAEFYAKHLLLIYTVKQPEILTYNMLLMWITYYMNESGSAICYGEMN